MKNYDIVFLGHMVWMKYTTLAVKSRSTLAALYCAARWRQPGWAARVAVVTRMAPWDEQMLNGLVASVWK
jgi:hypothetical protein